MIKVIVLAIPTLLYLMSAWVYVPTALRLRTMLGGLLYVGGAGFVVGLVVLGFVARGYLAGQLGWMLVLAASALLVLAALLMVGTGAFVT